MAFLKCLLYLNLIMGILNVMLLTEVTFQALVKKNCTYFQKNAVSIEYRSTPVSVDDRYSPSIAAILALEEIEADDYDFICATVIVSVFHSLAACHCIDYLKYHNAKTIKVRSGSTIWIEGGVLHDVIKIVRNENFNRHYFSNDIGIITVKPAFFKSDVISVAGINYNLRVKSPIDVTGWGIEHPEKSDPVKSTTTHELHTMTVYTISSNICARMINEYLRKTDPDVSHYHKLDNTQFCARSFEGVKGSCVYDFGGLAIQENVLVGIVSTGASVCATKKYPAIYTNLGNLYGWLLNMTKLLGMQISFVNN